VKVLVCLKNDWKKGRHQTRISSYRVTIARNKKHGKPKTEEIEIKRMKRRREGEKSRIVEILAFYCVWSMKPTARGSRMAEP
jgi:hypothetical protein